MFFSIVPGKKQGSLFAYGIVDADETLFYYATEVMEYVAKLSKL